MASRLQTAAAQLGEPNFETYLKTH